VPIVGVYPAQTSPTISPTILGNAPLEATRSIYVASERTRASLLLYSIKLYFPTAGLAKARGSI
jgi:hypothetical protein